jgi:hypothetical protein
MREHPDHHDAELLLRLYDLRREAKLRQAREWFLAEFQAESTEDFDRRFPRGTEENAFFRMVTTYWEMASSIVNHGLITEEFFFENTGEFYYVWLKLKPLAPEARKKWKYPMWTGLEALAAKYEKWLARKAPGAIEAALQHGARVQGKKSG